jgi:hypothetical protein
LSACKSKRNWICIYAVNRCITGDLLHHAPNCGGSGAPRHQRAQRPILGHDSPLSRDAAAHSSRAPPPMAATAPTTYRLSRYLVITLLLIERVRRSVRVNDSASPPNLPMKRAHITRSRQGDGREQADHWIWPTVRSLPSWPLLAAVHWSSGRGGAPPFIEGVGGPHSAVSPLAAGISSSVAGELCGQQARALGGGPCPLPLSRGHASQARGSSISGWPTHNGVAARVVGKLCGQQGRASRGALLGLVPHWKLMVGEHDRKVGAILTHQASLLG